MVTKKRTSYLIISEKIDDIVTEYMKRFDIVNYFNQREYDFNWGKYIKRSKLTEMIHNKEYERWGDLKIEINDNVKKVTCYSNNRIFTDICEGLETLLQDEINISFDVLIVTEYCENTPAP